MNKTIEAFKEDISNSKKLKEKILLNIVEESKEEIILNLIELNFNFTEKKVELIYYVIDEDYPNIKIDFTEFRNIINS